MYTLILHILLTTLAAHDLHLSSTTVHVRTDKNRVEIATHLFLDDVELALKKVSPEELKLCTPYEAASADSLLMDYIKNHLKISMNDKEQTLTVLGKEPSEDFQAVWVYLTIENMEYAEEITIHCDYLHEVYDDQRNLVNLKKDRKKLKTALLDSDKRSVSVPY